MAMATANRIKIIKHTERRESQAVPMEKSKAHTRNSAEGKNRDASAVVSGWVREWRRKKVAEAGRGFESLFGRAAVGGSTRG